jgi:hypothetical protein
MSATSELERVNINSLSKVEKDALTENIFYRKSYFQTLFNNKDNVELNCEQSARRLRSEIDRLLLEKNLLAEPVPLENLHQYVSEEIKAYNINDGVNKISSLFYDTDDVFQEAYYQLIRDLRKNYFPEPFWFQATPTIRIHCPNGINNHHYPRYHNDIAYGHPPEEINLWLPLTSVLTGHGFRTMSLLSSIEVMKKFNFNFDSLIQNAIEDKVFSNYCDELSNPVTTELGNILAFDSRCIHTGEPLKIHTRASMDIRILPTAQYEKMDIQYQGSGRRKILFAPGHCYHEKNSDHI